MKRVRLSGQARSDIKRVLRRSETEFGLDARTRYKTLLDQALSDLSENAELPRVKSVDDIRPGYFVYHIKWSKQRASGPVIKHPRHLLVFSADKNDTITIAAVIHERELLERHLES